ncbi:hypothetical protein CALVIDRAFT_225470 [Calocera viscosa TUFC12733]|uniref:Uncharacterized protein n=1 Tax=Calocera viscosa (strain TUFC12733) TaxID=1330018 RepID=A0A167K0V9_CALVF|nr:hypothetical protein CALVIDRAFT_225470 [Calocera viscosa TUFC12733]
MTFPYRQDAMAICPHARRLFIFALPPPSPPRNQPRHRSPVHALQSALISRAGRERANSHCKTRRALHSVAPSRSLLLVLTPPTFCWPVHLTSSSSADPYFRLSFTGMAN